MSHHNQGVGRCDWRTPEDVLERVRLVFGGPIALDPCTALDNPTKALAPFTEHGLEVSWLIHSNVFMNPPWSRDLKLYAWHWAANMWHVAQDQPNKQMIEVLPASVNSEWFHKWVMPCTAICFPRGRIKYVPPPGYVPSSSPTFDSAIAYWGPAPLHFKSHFEGLGAVMQPV